MGALRDTMSGGLGVPPDSCLGVRLRHPESVKVCITEGEVAFKVVLPCGSAVVVEGPEAMGLRARGKCLASVGDHCGQHALVPMFRGVLVLASAGGGTQHGARASGRIQQKSWSIHESSVQNVRCVALSDLVAQLGGLKVQQEGRQGISPEERVETFTHAPPPLPSMGSGDEVAHGLVHRPLLPWYPTVKVEPAHFVDGIKVAKTEASLVEHVDGALHVPFRSKAIGEAVAGIEERVAVLLEACGFLEVAKGLGEVFREVGAEEVGVAEAVECPDRALGGSLLVELDGAGVVPVAPLAPEVHTCRSGLGRGIPGVSRTVPELSGPDLVPREATVAPVEVVRQSDHGPDVSVLRLGDKELQLLVVLAALPFPEAFLVGLAEAVHLMGRLESGNVKVVVGHSGGGAVVPCRRVVRLLQTEAVLVPVRQGKHGLRVVERRSRVQEANPGRGGAGARFGARGSALALRPVKGPASCSGAAEGHIHLALPKHWNLIHCKLY
mmetsp:Transcript_2121/g.6125  ORF Transcript_2121/g.6125 Transcript_2121/m.6125 type:complete len:496 (-) Transcript_2121:185-1672(-)